MNYITAYLYSGYATAMIGPCRARADARPSRHADDRAADHRRDETSQSLGSSGLFGSAVRLARWRSAPIEGTKQGYSDAVPARSISAYRRLLAVVAVAAALLAATPARGAARHRARQRRSHHGFRHRTAQQADPADPNKTPARQEVIDELIDEKLKLQLLKRFTIEGMDLEVDSAYANMARRARMTLARPHRHARKKRHQARHAQVAPQGRADLEPGHPRPLPEQLPVLRKGRDGEAGAQQSGDPFDRIRLHAASDPVRGAPRLAGRPARTRGARKPKRCAPAS